MGDVTSEGMRRRRRRIRKVRRRRSNKAKWKENSDPAETDKGKKVVFQRIDSPCFEHF